MEKDTAAIYTTEGATLYHADFLDVAERMEDSSMDLVFTDPPFELTGGGMKNGKLNYKGDEVFKNCGFSTKTIAFVKWIPAFLSGGVSLSLWAISLLSPLNQKNKPSGNSPSGT